MDFFIRYGTSWQTNSTVRRPTAHALRKGHAVRLDGGPRAASLCGRSRLSNDVDDREQDFTDLLFPVRCAVCAGLVAALSRADGR